MTNRFRDARPHDETHAHAAAEQLRHLFRRRAGERFRAVLPGHHPRGAHDGGDAAMAVILGSQTSALNSILHYQVQEERSADESAIKLLNKTKQSTNGLLSFMKKIKKQNTLSGIEENSYFRTHPLTSERISHFEDASKGNSYSEKNTYDNEFLLVKAKLTAFLSDKNKTMRLYPNSDMPAVLRRSNREKSLKL